MIDDVEARVSDGEKVRLDFCRGQNGGQGKRVGEQFGRAPGFGRSGRTHGFDLIGVFGEIKG